MKRREKDTSTIKFMLITLVAVMFLIYSEEAAASVRESLVFAASTVIPSLFPFMVISRILNGAGVTSSVTKHVERFSLRAFSLGSESMGAVILGFISGFPIGALTVCESYKNMRISKAEAERALALSHNTGPSFPIGLVGSVLWRNKTFGVYLYLSQIVSWLVVTLYTKEKLSAGNRKSNAVDGVCKRPFGELAADSVSASAVACVQIAGFVTFMRLVPEIIVAILPKMSFYADALLFSAFEFSSGCKKASVIGGIFGCTVTGFAIGFGGLSAFFQSAAPALKLGLSVKRLFSFKVIQGIFCAVLSALYPVFFTLNTPPASKPVLSTYHRTEVLCITSIIFLTLIIKKLIKDVKRS